MLTDMKMLGAVFVVWAGMAGAQQPAVNAPTKPPTGYVSIEVLWPGGAPGAVGTESDDVPKLYCYPAPGEGVHNAVVVLPGGGYKALVMGKEGDAFDPALHNAVSHVEDEKAGENTVVKVFQKGYRIGDRIIRHAMVQVAN